jgi:hypothetical protein
MFHAGLEERSSFWRIFRARSMVERGKAKFTDSDLKSASSSVWPWMLASPCTSFEHPGCMASHA